MGDNNPVSDQPPDINELIQQLNAKDEIIRNLQSANFHLAAASQKDLDINVPANRIRLDQDGLKSANDSQQLINDVNSHVAKLSLQFDSATQQIAILEEREAKANEKISELSEQKSELQKMLDKSMQEVGELKMELASVKESATVAINQDLQMQLAALSIAKKRADDELAKSTKKVAALVECNSSLCEKAELLQNKLTETEKLREKDLAQNRVMGEIAADAVMSSDGYFFESWESSAETDFDLGRYERALEIYVDITILNEALYHYPGMYWRYWKNVSECYYKLGRYEEALQAIDKEIEARKTDAIRYGIEDGPNAVTNQPNAVSFYLRGLIHEKLGNRDQAILDFKKSLEFDPTYMEAKFELEELGEIEMGESDWSGSD